MVKTTKLIVYARKRIVFMNRDWPQELNCHHRNLGICSQRPVLYKIPGIRFEVGKKIVIGSRKLHFVFQK